MHKGKASQKKAILHYSVRQHRQKTFVTLSRFWLLIKEVGEWGVGGLSESVKKGKFATENLFSDNIE